MALVLAAIRLRQLPPRFRMLLLLYPSLAILALSGAFLLVRGCVLATPPETDFLNILQFGLPGWATLTLLTLAWLCVYLLSQALLSAFRSLGYAQNRRIFLFALSALLAWVPGLGPHLQIQAPLLALLFFSYLLLFDLYLDYRNSSLAWTLIWAFFLAGLGAAWINVFRTEKAALRMAAQALPLLAQGPPSDATPGERVYARILDRMPPGAPQAFSGAFRDKTGTIQTWGKHFPTGITPFLNTPPNRLDRLISASKGRIQAQSHDRRLWTQSGLLIQLKWDQKGNTLALIWPLAGLRQLLPLFSLLFLSLVLCSALLAFLNRKGKLLPSQATLPFDWGPRFRSRIQRLTLGVVGLSFTLIFLFAFPYLERAIVQKQENQWIAKAAALRQELSEAWISTEAPDSVVLESLARQYDTDIDLYDEKGRLLGSSNSEIYRKGWRTPAIPQQVVERLKSRPGSVAISRETVQAFPLKVLYSPGDSGFAYMSLPAYAAAMTAAEEIGGFLGAMLTVSVFLLLIAAGLAMLIANRFSAPLLEISERLRAMKIDGNQRLEWPDSGDEIGEIILAYNAAIEEVEQSAEKLKQTEREAAWKEMAKQVAHEIKNPLTPMKLNIQYLLHAFRQNPETAATLLPEAARTLTEQIDGLARIATEFSNFAQMPQAENTVFPLEEALSASVALFREQVREQGLLEYEKPDSGMLVYADKKQLIRVFNNLLQNALQAIPAGRTPHIRVHAAAENGSVRTAICDNGAGIPPEIQPKVFSPNFTTKSSGMGLGLAMCRNIVQQAEGRIYFETEEGKGTTFFVVLPQQ